MQINPVAIILWIFTGLVGYLISGDFQTTGIAVAVIMAISIVLGLLP